MYLFISIVLIGFVECISYDKSHSQMSNPYLGVRNYNNGFRPIEVNNLLTASSYSNARTGPAQRRPFTGKLINDHVGGSAQTHAWASAGQIRKPANSKRCPALSVLNEVRIVLENTLRDGGKENKNELENLTRYLRNYVDMEMTENNENEFLDSLGVLHNQLQRLQENKDPNSINKIIVKDNVHSSGMPKDLPMANEYRQNYLHLIDSIKNVCDKNQQSNCENIGREGISKYYNPNVQYMPLKNKLRYDLNHVRYFIRKKDSVHEGLRLIQNKTSQGNLENTGQTNKQRTDKSNDYLYLHPYYTQNNNKKYVKEKNINYFRDSKEPLLQNPQLDNDVIENVYLAHTKSPKNIDSIQYNISKNEPDVTVQEFRNKSFEALNILSQMNIPYEQYLPKLNLFENESSAKSEQLKNNVNKLQNYGTIEKINIASVNLNSSTDFDDGSTTNRNVIKKINSLQTKGNSIENKSEAYEHNHKSINDLEPLFSDRNDMIKIANLKLISSTSNGPTLIKQASLVYIFSNGSFLLRKDGNTFVVYRPEIRLNDVDSVLSLIQNPNSKERKIIMKNMLAILLRENNDEGKINNVVDTKLEDSNDEYQNDNMNFQSAPIRISKYASDTDFINPFISGFEHEINVTEYKSPTGKYIKVVQRPYSPTSKDSGSPDIDQIYYNNDVQNANLPPLLSSIPNPTLLSENQQMQDAMIVLTFLINKPTATIFQPYYYVKYKLSYNDFSKNILEILSKVPYLEADPLKLYQEVIKKTDLIEASPDLTKYNDESILKLVKTSGTLAEAKIIKNEDALLDGDLQRIRNINSDLITKDLKTLNVEHIPRFKNEPNKNLRTTSREESPKEDFYFDEDSVETSANEKFYRGDNSFNLYL